MATAGLPQPVRLQLRTRLTVGDDSPRQALDPVASRRLPVVSRRQRVPTVIEARRYASQARLRSVGSVLVQRDEPTRSGVSPIGRQRRRRDRHGRGLRGAIAPVGVPIARSSGDQFDELVLDAVEELERAWPKELAAVEFAVEDVPPAATTDTDIEFNPEVVADGPVPLGRLYRGGVESIKSPVIVIYRRPVEARTADKSERADLVFAVVAELVAELLGRDLDEIDPP